MEAMSKFELKIDQLNDKTLKNTYEVGRKFEGIRKWEMACIEDMEGIKGDNMETRDVIGRHEESLKMFQEKLDQL